MDCSLVMAINGKCFVASCILHLREGNDYKLCPSHCSLALDCRDCLLQSLEMPGHQANTEVDAMSRESSDLAFIPSQHSADSDNIASSQKQLTYVMYFVSRLLCQMNLLQPACE